jgi:FkbM family methyltransferase
MTTPVNRKPIKYSWSHRLWIHRFLVKIYNALARCIPFGIKYPIGKFRRRNRYPYRLIRPGTVVVQIGAPVDTLGAGRSRAMYFSLFNGPTGKTVIVEPARESADAFQAIARMRGNKDIAFICAGAWSARVNLTVYFDPKHPATNFTEGTVDYPPERLAEFQKVSIPCDTIDNLLSAHGIGPVDLLSITTNGAEVEILNGMRNTLQAGVEYICLALHNHCGDMAQVMANLGYDEFAFDDRGITYRKRRPGTAASDSRST